MITRSRLGASSADRWMICPASAVLSADVPRKGSVYASYGTVLHDVAAWCLRHNLPANAILSKEEDAAPVQAYLDVANGLRQDGDECRAEVSLSAALKKIDPDLGAIADYVCWRPATRELLVIEFKSGANVEVEAEDNRQLKICALGAILELRAIAASIVGVIVQPRLGDHDRRIKRLELDPLDLLVNFVGELRAAAEATRKPEPPVVPGEKQCRWCPAGEAGLCDQRVRAGRRRTAGVAVPADFEDLTKES